VAYSTLFSNGAPAVPSAIALDSAGEVVISGMTSSAAFPSTAGAYNNPWNTTPPFVTKLDATGTKLIFSAVGVGGSSVALDPAGNIVVSGSTTSGLYPVTAGVFQSTVATKPQCDLVGPCSGEVYMTSDQYATRMRADGSKLLYSTFLTGSSGSYNTGLAVDGAGDVWVTGITDSSDYPYTGASGANGHMALFTGELDPTGSKLLVSVQQGGSSLTLDPLGNVVVGGYWPVSPFPEQYMD